MQSRLNLSYQEYLLRLLEAQVLTKIDRSINRRIQLAGFPQLRHLEEFDFSFQPQLNEKLIRELASSLTFITDPRNIVFLGPPGVGKTFLATALGIKACKMRRRVMFYTAEFLIQIDLPPKNGSTLQLGKKVYFGIQEVRYLWQEKGLLLNQSLQC